MFPAVWVWGCGGVCVSVAERAGPALLPIKTRLPDLHDYQHPTHLEGAERCLGSGGESSRLVYLILVKELIRPA